MRKVIVGIICIMLLSTVGFAGDKDTLECREWINQDINKLVKSWSKPEKISDMSNGHKIYTWMRATSTLSKRERNLESKIITGGNVVTEYCYKNFEVDQTGKIVNFTLRGDLCDKE
jgi:hypothetical protein